MNWRQLKEFANSLDEKELDKNVILWRESEAIKNIEAEVLSDDHYIGKDEEGCYTLQDAGLELEDVAKENLKKVFDKGSPVLLENF